MPGLSDRRVVLVTGKGGVGKTTVAVSLALAAARRGKRVLLCETQGATRVPALFGRPSKGYEPTQVATNLSTLSITPAEAIQEYVLLQLHFVRLYKMVFQNRVMGPFVDAVPGLHDLVQLGKVWFAERETENGRQRWDLVVVDAPATGHGLTMLGAPRAMMELTRAGPFYENAKQIAELVEDPVRTGLVLVTTPEEMPLRETESLHQRLGAFRRLVAGVVLNEVHPLPVPDLERWPEERLRLSRSEDPAMIPTLRVIDAELRACARQVDARVRLRALGAAYAELPFLFRRDLGRAELESFTAPLGSLT
ncbi:ATPase [Deltaproteobacteria bacterium]|nr:ATPase [Deltaproteobacteria bacterium]